VTTSLGAFWIIESNVFLMLLLLVGILGLAYGMANSGAANLLTTAVWPIISLLELDDGYVHTLKSARPKFSCTAIGRPGGEGFVTRTSDRNTHAAWLGRLGP
jgi:hypothetical protein